MLAVWKVRARAARPKGPSDPPELKPYVELIPGSDVKFEMLPIPGGTFKMGSPPGELGRSDDEGPQHPVTVHPFWMGKAEVTWDEYDIFAFSQDIYKKQELGVNLATQPDNEKAADALTRPTPPYTDETFGFGRKGHPAINITHHAAVEYCRWLSAKTGKTYRLPTEAEWEYACRAGTETTYFFGDNSAGVGDYAWYMENSGARPHAGGQKKPSPWGLYDILGNLAEWCLDRYDKDLRDVQAERSNAAARAAARQGKISPRRPRRVVGRQAAAPPQRSAARLERGLDHRRPAAAAKHLVADGRAVRRLSHRPAARRAGQSKRFPVSGDKVRLKNQSSRGASRGPALFMNLLFQE